MPRRIQLRRHKTKHLASADYDGNRRRHCWRLALNDIHVWISSLDVEAAALSSFEKILSSLERERTQRFRFDLHRNRFVVGRVFMRTLLSHYLKIHPAKLQFNYNHYGKPLLDNAFVGSQFNFNLSHCEDLAILAITRVGPIGIDLERIRPLTDIDHIGASIFSARENDVFHNLPVKEKPAAFFNLWTRKEAWLKATGEGISHLLKAVEVTFLPGEPVRFLSLPRDPQNRAGWVLHELKPASGFVAALAVPAQGTDLRCYCWDKEDSKEMISREFSPQQPFPLFSRCTLIKPARCKM